LCGASADRPIKQENFARAALILCVIGIILWIVAGGIFMGALSDIISELY
jgi:hypothetical protein